MVEVSSDMIGLEAASDALAKLEADASAGAGAAAKPTGQSASGTPAADAAAPEGQRAAQAGETQDQTPAKAGEQTPDSISLDPAEQGQKKTDTQATTDKQNQQQQDAGKNAGGKEPSKYAKERGRQESAWKQINADKEAISRERAAIEADRKKLTEERQAFSQERQKAQPKPEDYEAYAAKCEKEGKFDLAEAARAEAKKLRDNPPKTDEQKTKEQTEAFEKSKKEWWGKASQDFRNVASKGTPENLALQEFIKLEPNVLQDPKAMYYACELIQQRTVAARVPGLEKELGALRAKVKELEQLTSPNPPGLPGQGNGPSAKTEAQELSELEQLATTMGPLR